MVARLRAVGRGRWRLCDRRRRGSTIRRREPALDYEPVGSLAGTMRVKDRRADFGASDVPLSSEELAKLGLGQFPVVMGGVVAWSICLASRRAR